MKREKSFIYFAAACAFITAITTVAIHQISIPSGSFGENVLLYKNNLYQVQNWIIMFHCLMVLISMLGMALVLATHSRSLAILGFIFFAFFVFTEWERTLDTLWHINGLRKRYSLATDENMLKSLQFEIQNRQFQSNVQFLLFTIGISLGNASYGLALINNKGLDRFLGAGLLLWSCFTSLAFIYDFYPAQWMATIVDTCNKYYQPLIRLLIAYWLFKKAKSFSKL